ncbi:hypothetical protein HDE68_004046 [Pedobacter cryoconitis]|uniref:Uncharacterized protein n=1 Tax=Pedobacter cryoconitis TaxID=188932 RepID=A0A7W8ZQH2_9SPHI|nr:hypothetical protein [Pedobacter cryoconitis]MBB5638120.1 hypothetical protein [Pedobacter cryoconitis]
MIKYIKNIRFLLSAIACLLIVCVLDFLTPPDIITGILYIPAIILVIHETRKTILFFLIIACLMSIANFIYFTQKHASFCPLYLINSIIVLFGIGTTTFVIFKYKIEKDKFDDSKRLSKAEKQPGKEEDLSILDL